MTGYLGYYLDARYLFDPPPWLDTAQIIIKLTRGLLFLVILKDFQQLGRLNSRTIFPIVLWTLAGFLSGFKTYVVAPSLFVLASAWMANRSRVIHFFFLFGMIAISYWVIQPMREIANSRQAVSAQEGLKMALGSDSFATMKVGEIIDLFAQRVDLSVVGIRALDAYEHDRIPQFKMRLDEYYKLSPIMAFVPRALWAEKPLENLGAVLDRELNHNLRSSVSPSHVVASYIWAGWFGVVLNSVVWGVLCTIGGQIIVNSISAPLQRAPFIIWALTLSNAAGIMVVYYIMALRTSLCIFLLCQARLLREAAPASKAKEIAVRAGDIGRSFL